HSHASASRRIYTRSLHDALPILGPSGGGKTTAASLIPRFWDADSGSVTVGGADVRKLDSAALMGQVAFVFQDTRLFKESGAVQLDRKSTRLNSSHVSISYAVFCL